MASSQAIVNPASAAVAVCANWIISFGDDALWFVGSVAASYAFLLLYRLLGVPALGLIIIWVMLFDGPHIFGTFTRTYLDREMRARHAWLLYGSLVLFVIGPLCAVLPSVVTSWTPRRPLLLFVSANSFVTFIFVASMWAYYHIVKQHYGFMMLYKKKNDDLLPADNKIDRWLLWATLMYPFVRYMLRVPDARDMWPVSPTNWIAESLETIALVVMVLAVAVFGVRTVMNVVRHRTLDLPKLLFLAAVIPMHWIVLMGSLPPRVMVPILTVSHNIQYHRLIWFHNRNKYADDRSGRYGVVSRISRSALAYYLVGILFAAYRLPNAFYGDSDLLVGLLWGFSLVHYYLDGKIWRVRNNPELMTSLRLSRVPAP